MSILLGLLPSALALTTGGLAVYACLTTSPMPDTHPVGRALWYYGAALLIAGIGGGVALLALGIAALAQNR
jgi:hypothetical protein